ncbi:zinc-binding dehydrogenase [Radiobacillus sp. PE A8.2]|uniref:zinc-dependent alcohol dehydrogenase n=1 Tax=Radiobacillus sp. PE A8.2 TaxID=3380349 RepID=UPI00388E1FA3
MKGLWFVELGKVEMKEERMPECTTDTILLKTLYSGLTNGTERSRMMNGAYGQPYPNRIGYQTVAKVVECGADVTNYQVGDLVFVGKNTGHVEYILAKETDLIVKLPSNLEPHSAALLGVASVPFHDARRGKTEVGDRVLITGAGLIGLFALQAVHAMGASQITVMDGNPERLQLAKKLGADTIINYRSDEERKQLKEHGPFSLVLECSGADNLNELIGVKWGGGVLQKFGRIVLIGGREEVKYNFMAATSKQISVISASHFDKDDLENVARLASRGSIQLESLIKEIIPIDKAVKTYEKLRDQPREMLGVVFDWT